MDDLISRQAVIDALSNGALVNYQFAGHHNGLVKAIDVIKGLPPAQSGIIYCRDCKHYEFSDNRAFGFPEKRCEWCGFEDIDDDDFCSRAERREK